MSVLIENIPSKYAYTNINSGAGFIIQKGAGTVHDVKLVNAGSAWEVDVYDGTTSAGTRMAFIRGATTPTIITLDLPFITGLFFDTVKGTTVGELVVTIL